MKRLSIAVSVLFIIFHMDISIYSQAGKKIKFERFTVEQGLSQNTIYCILQDKRGFIWIGTEDGLNRYDGYKFVVYRNKTTDNTSLSGNCITALYEDSEETLWVGTEKGLNRYDRRTEQFIHPETLGDLHNSHITAIAEDHSGAIWVGVKEDKLIFKLNRKNQRFISIHIPYASACIREDKFNTLWIGTEEGIFTFDPRKKVCIKYADNPPDKKNCPSEIRTIYEDRSGTLWIGTKNGGLRQFDRKNHRFIPVQFDKRISDCSDSQDIHSIFNDKRGNLWIGTQTEGLYVRLAESKIFVNYRNKSEIPTSLSNNYIYTIYEDISGILWIGTEGGLNKLDWAKNEFVHWAKEPGNSQSLSGNYVWCFYEDKHGVLWIGNSAGLNKFEKEKGIFTLYPPTGTPSNNNVMSIHEDKSGLLWIGTQGGGLYIFDKKIGKFTNHYSHENQNPNSLSHNRVTVIHESRDQTLWIGTEGGGLNRFDRKIKKFAIYKNISHVTCLFEDKPGEFWIGSSDGLTRFNRTDETFTPYKNDPTNEKSLSFDFVSAVYIDRSGILWVATYNGLNRFDREKGTFTRYWEENSGLPSSTIYGILEDEKGYLWISTGKGISKFDPRKGDAEKNYDARDGLQGDEFNGGSYYKSPTTGEMYFGGPNGFTAFLPANIKTNIHPPPTVITNFLLFNEPYFQNESIIEKNEFELEFNQDVFTIEFAVLDFSIPGKNKYKYKMDNVDPDWVKGDADKRFATYTKLAPKKYIFRIIGINNDGVESDKQTSIAIIIKPPFYRTWWFMITVLLIIILSLFVGYRIRTRYLRNKLAEQERIQKILKESRDEMERARDMAEIRHAENEKLLTAISSIFIAVDSDGIIFQWNAPTETLFQISSDEAVRKPFTQILKDYISQNKINEIMEKGLKQDKSSKIIEIHVDLKSKGKGLKLLLCSVNPIIDSMNRKLGFLLMAEDVTNRKKEEMLRNLSKKLESLGQMASSIAHEIKTPLQYIGHNAQFVIDSFKEVIRLYEMMTQSLPGIENTDKKEITGKIKAFIEEYDMEYIMQEIPVASDQIINGVNKVSDIVTAMNEFSHPGRGFKEKADINGLLKSTLIMVQDRIKKNADIRLDFFEELPPAPCFPGELNQVFLNILVNAVDAIVESGKWGLIKISTSISADGDEALISISDSGCGIPDENKENIFNPFFTTKEVGKGTGQGLSLAHNIIHEKHKGKIEYTSKVGEGTTFYIRLPFEGEH